MTMGFRYSLSKMAVELARSRGNLHRMTDRCAHNDAAAYSTRELAALLRDNADHPGGRRSAGSRRPWATM
ncbi:hypothetical protein ACFQX6_09290 [Streptosporangium lutulentum]